jgi:hypothetical protein
MMSEAELHQLKQRMLAGARHKAERGELRQGLPVGLARGPAAAVILNPDEEVQARIRLVFEKFREIRSESFVMRYLRAAHLPLPACPRVGPAPERGWSGNQPAPQPFSIFSTTRPMLGPLSRDASSLTRHAALQGIQVAGGFSSPLTSGRCVYTIDIQRLFRGTNLSPIRTNYAPIA